MDTQTHSYIDWQREGWKDTAIYRWMQPFRGHIVGIMSSSPEVKPHDMWKRMKQQWEIIVSRWTRMAANSLLVLDVVIVVVVVVLRLMLVLCFCQLSLSHDVSLNVNPSAWYTYVSLSPFVGMWSTSRKRCGSLPSPRQHDPSTILSVRVLWFRRCCAGGDLAAWSISRWYLSCASLY